MVTREDKHPPKNISLLRWVTSHCNASSIFEVRYTSDYYLHDFSAHKVQNASQIFDNLWNLPVDASQVQYLRLQRI
jgi:hypothetical protein